MGGGEVKEAGKGIESVRAFIERTFGRTQMEASSANAARAEAVRNFHFGPTYFDRYDLNGFGVRGGEGDYSYRGPFQTHTALPLGYISNPGLYPPSTMAQATLVSNLAKQGYYMSSTPLAFDLPALQMQVPSPSSPTGSKNAFVFLVLQENGEWKPLQEGETPTNGAILAKGYTGSPFHLQDIINSQLGIYRYEKGPLNRAVLFGFEYFGDVPRNEPTPEFRLTRRLGRSAAYVQLRYSGVFAELKASRWSRREIDKLIDLITEGSDAASLDQSFHEIIYYQRMAKDRGWTHEQTRDFLLRFAESRKGHVNFGSYFARHLHKALDALAKQSFLPEQAANLLLELAKYDSSLRSWGELEWLFHQVESIGRAFSERTVVASAFSEGIVYGGNNLGASQVTPDVFGFAEGIFPQQVAVHRLGIETSRLEKLLVQIAERAGEDTTDTYRVLVESVRGDKDSSPVENLARFESSLESLIHKTSLPMTRLSDWHRLSSEQRSHYFETVQFLTAFLDFIPDSSSDKARRISIMALDSVMAPDEPASLADLIFLQ